MTNNRKHTRDRKDVTVPDNTGEDESLGIARAVLGPTLQAAYTMRECSRVYSLLELPGLVDALREQTSATVEGNLNRAETMLTAQAHTLDAIFNCLARHAFNSEHVANLERYLKLALRTQVQCRMTWESLATIKNPPTIGCVRQTN